MDGNFAVGQMTNGIEATTFIPSLFQLASISSFISSKNEIIPATCNSDQNSHNTVVVQGATPFNRANIYEKQYPGHNKHMSHLFLIKLGDYGTPFLPEYISLKARRAGGILKVRRSQAPFSICIPQRSCKYLLGASYSSLKLPLPPCTWM